uniref:Uncharacterized protein n=1 Tax=Globisporangium ultimum (strain ATCC 200006 / CBS 805.95 / DAOM BR144) TaxID=431595 RepID=K3WUJ0_GLOUD
MEAFCLGCFKEASVVVLSRVGWILGFFLPALTSNPDRSCESKLSASSHSFSDKSVVANAIIAAFAMTWTSWRTSSAASSMFAKKPPLRPSRVKESANGASKQFSGVVVAHLDGTQVQATADQLAHAIPNDAEKREPWQFYCM